MNDYLKSISNIDTESARTTISSSPEKGYSVLELPEQPPAKTSSSMVEKEPQTMQDTIQYLSPQKVKLRKYTIKKG